MRKRPALLDFINFGGLRWSPGQSRNKEEQLLFNDFRIVQSIVDSFATTKLLNQESTSRSAKPLVLCSLLEGYTSVILTAFDCTAGNTLYGRPMERSMGWFGWFYKALLVL